MNNWYKDVRRILECESNDLIALANAVGIDPIYFYRYANLNGTDLRGQDLRGLDFTGSTLEGCVLDQKTLIDPQFDPRSEGDFVKRSVSLPRNLYICVRTYEADTNYTYTGWAIKALLEVSFFECLRHGAASSWLEWYKESKDAQYTVDQQGARSYFLKIRSDHYQSAVDHFSVIGGRSKGLRLALLVGMFRYWNADRHDVGGGSLVDFLRRVPKRPRAEDTLLSLARNWTYRSQDLRKLE